MNLPRWLRPFTNHVARAHPITLRLAVECLEARDTPSTGGLLDPTFGTGGHVLSSFTNNLDEAFAVTVQPDGKIVTAGGTLAFGSATGEDYLVARYNANGTLDTTFGTSGRTVTDFNGMTDHAAAVALQTQANGTNKILVAGWAYAKQKGGTPTYGLVRYNANGTLDTTFGSKGKVTIDVGGGHGADAMVVQPDGKIVLAGLASSNSVAALVRYNANGTLDTTFGSGGKIITAIRDTTNVGVALQPQANGTVKILLAGEMIGANTTFPLFVARFNANGTADTTFGTSGQATTLLGQNDHFGGVAVQGDGKIVVSGSEASFSFPHALYLVRYNANGIPDAGFGPSGNGTVAVPSPGAPGDGGVDAHHSGVAVQSDGKIVAGGQYFDATAQEWTMVALRVDSTGTVDAGYGTGGWARTQFGNADNLNAIALQPDGGLVLAGYARPALGSTPIDVALVRFLGSAPQIGSFAASAPVVTAGDSLTLTATNVADGNPNSTVTTIEFYYFDASGTKHVLGTGTQTSPGVWEC